VRTLAAAGLVWVLAAAPSAGAPAPAPTLRVLAFTKTAAFHHDSIPAAVAALRGAALHLDATDDAAAFTDGNLARYDVVVFLLTTGDVLDPAQQAAFERFVRSGGGYAGVHSASDTEYDWPWYGRLVGAYFRTHPAVQPATVDVVDPNDPSTAGLPRQWKRIDEWYAFRVQPAGVHVLLTVDEASYQPGDAGMGSTHPIAWEHAYDGGRAWYTAGGHTSESWSEPLFVAHVVGGIRWAAGTAPPAVGPLRGTRSVTARVSGCRRCAATVTIGGKRSAVRIRGGVVRFAVPGGRRASLRVVNLANGLATTRASAGTGT
jgi:type 1 glutamine amidotransferase